MGKHDNRKSLKMRQRDGQRKKKARLKRHKAARAAERTKASGGKRKKES